MNITLEYKNAELKNYEELLGCFTEWDFASPCRSTIPNLAYWFFPDIKKRVSKTCELLKLSEPAQLTATFEYKVKPPAGKGKASHTDLMLTWGNHCIAIEAKYTEGKYETVGDWLKKEKAVDEGKDDESNREKVLGGWCNLINDKTGAKLNKNNVNDLTYQILHRVASACATKAENCTVIYQVFYPPEVDHNYYVKALEALYKQFERPKNLALYLFEIPIKGTSQPYAELQKRWRYNREIHFNNAVLNFLKEGSFMKFGEPEVYKIQ